MRCVEMQQRAGPMIDVVESRVMWRRVAVDVGRFERHQRASNGYTSAKSTRPYASNGTHLWGRSTRVPTLTCHNFFSCGKVANHMVMHQLSQPFAENKYDLPRLKLPMVSWTYYIEHII